jgi:hypothetical protein
MISLLTWCGLKTKSIHENYFIDNQKIFEINVTSLPPLYLSLNINTGMLDCPASGQFGTGMKKTNNAGTCPVLGSSNAVRHFFGPVQD